MTANNPVKETDMIIPDNYLTTIVLIVYLCAFLVQGFYLFFFYMRVAMFRQEAGTAKPEPISVIICARDEASHLEKFLPQVLTQDYPDYEVIVVNDCSEDRTGEVLEQLAGRYPHLRVTTIKKDEKFRHGKKLALAIGIKAAKHDLLLLTDADCVPVSKYWTRDIQKHFGKETDFVLGYGGYFSGKGWLNLHIRMDTAWIAMHYLGYALAGIPYMGVGRNLAYRKKIFFENRGFASHTHLESGDDDLFVNAHARKNNTRVEIAPTAHTRSVPAGSLKEWLIQKQRHITTGSRYRKATRWLLGGEWFSRILFYAGFITLLFIYEPWYIPLSVFVLRWLMQLIVFKIVMRRLNENNLLLYSLFYDAVQPFLNMLLFLAARVKARKSKWK